MEKQRRQRQEAIDQSELKFNVEWIRNQKEITGWVGNIKVISHYDDQDKEYTTLLVYVLQQNGEWVKCIYEQMPYFFAECDQESIQEVMMHLENKYEKQIAAIEIVEKIDLEQINHLSGKMKQYIKMSFRQIHDLVTVRNQLRQKLEKSEKRMELELELLIRKNGAAKDILDHLIDIREYDVPYHGRVCIDTGIRCGKWFTFGLMDKKIVEITERADIITMPDLRYISFDIETTKQPRKFPDAKHDQIMMISLTYREKSLLITNREILGQDVLPFEYAPKPQFATSVEVYNEINEKDLLLRFFNVITDYKPLIITSFNGDRFDWPFIEERCMQHGFYLDKELGIKRSDESQEYFGRFLIHLDCFPWVERDAYLPQGSHGLKEVTRKKLYYEPVEVDPEEMMRMAREESQKFAEYSISDSCATYFIYKLHIHDFILALCTIIPLNPDEVLRKGSGTLCECLLMAMAYNRTIIFPNKKKEPLEKFHQGHLLDSETYIGGKVECLRSGIYRSDIDVEFKMDKECLLSMWSGAERLIRFVGEVENHEFSEEEISECALQIRAKIDGLLAKGEVYKEKPLIYHLDVAAMYPNIILTNRLQPVSIVDNRICSGCVFNTASSKCKRDLEWQWKVEYFPLQRNEYEHVKKNLEYEMLQRSQREMAELEAKQRQQMLENPQQRYDKKNKQQQWNAHQQQQFKQLKDQPFDQQQKLLKQRAKLYSQKTYKMAHQHNIILKKDTVCMRENDFYVSTVRDFRDRRYEFKEFVKIYKGKVDEAKKAGATGAVIKELQDRIALYDSLQLAHKIILNSFYGYVMRKGARWYSMQMAGIVTHMGSQIISTAKQWVDKIGLPLELDTDGIWCLLPAGFPEDFTIKNTTGKNIKFSYPCHILNMEIYDKYKNKQYQWVKDQETLDYGIRTEMSIFFEIDGPYRCMIIPAAREENKQLKKRYVVYNKNGSIAEIKGFEIKRRGELKIIKQFQQEIFSEFLKGTTLAECYGYCATVGKKWMNILLSGGAGVPDEELFTYIGESRVLSKDVNDYETQKGVAITAGKRMAEYLGADQMKGGGINCLYIISKLPHNTPVNERSIPISVFELPNKDKYLRKWLKQAQLKEEDMTLQKIVDWNYYIERLGNTIQKLIVIPAVLQSINNPIPEVEPPEWLGKRIREQLSGLHQQKINQYFQVKNKAANQFAQLRHQPIEIEDIGKQMTSAKKKQPIIEDVIQQTQQQQLHNPYDMETDFKRFLVEQQKQWTHQFRNKNKKQKQGGNIRNLLFNMQQYTRSSIWQILQIYEISPGLFNAWILLENGHLTQETIEMNRTIYINSYKQEPNQTIVKKSLPRDAQAYYLYSHTMSEVKFQQDYNGYSHFLANPDIEGIYEQNISLMFKFITELGCMCKLNRNCNSQGNNTNKKQQQLQFKNKTVYQFDDLTPEYILQNQTSYLQTKEGLLLQQYLLIQHVQLSDDRSIWTMFCGVIDEYVVIVVSKQRNVDNLKALVRDALNTAALPYELSKQSKVRVVALQSHKEAMLFIQNSFETYNQQENQRLFASVKLCVISSEYEMTYLQSQGMTFICQDFPTMFIKKVDISQLKLSALDWHQKIIRQLISEYEKVPQQLSALIQHSRYASIPLCNINTTQLGVNAMLNSASEQLGYVTDVIFSRALKRLFNCISWYGQGLQRDNRDLIPSEFTPSSYYQSGAHMNYCVEIDILHLALNTIALSDELKHVDREASALIGQQVKADQLESLDELVGAKLAFKVLKTLVTGWLEDALTKGDELSDQHLQNITCWVYSGQSPLHDPFLGKMLKRLNLKLFNYFTSKLIQLGAKIIYSSFNKVIISTGKQSLETAQSYISYILTTMTQQPLFKYLTLQPTKYYTTLIYLDPYNYLGYYTEESENKIDFKLKLMDFLPMALQLFLKRTLVDVLIKAQNFKEDTIQELSFQPINIQITRTQSLETDTIDFIVNYVDTILAQRLYNAMDLFTNNFKEERKQYEVFKSQEQTMQMEELNTDKKAKRRVIDDEDEQFEDEQDYEQDSFVAADDEMDQLQQTDREASEDEDILINQGKDKRIDQKFEENWMMNKTIGAKLEQTSDDCGVLRMLTYIVKILGVHQDIEQSMLKIKSNCCRTLQQSEHSKEADFVEPCLELLIQNITCSECFNVCDLDVFKSEWVCLQCTQQYNFQYIEERICKFLEEQLLLYQGQDMYCLKCKQIQDYVMQERCACSGLFELKQDIFDQSFIKTPKYLIASLRQLAMMNELHSLNTLLDVLSL